MQLKWVKLTHVNTCIERVLYSKRHQYTYTERERQSFSLIVKRLSLFGHRRFGTAYLSHFQGSRCQDGHIDPWRWERYNVPKHRLPNKQSRATSQKSEGLTNPRRKIEVSCVHSGAENVLDSYHGGIYESWLCADEKIWNKLIINLWYDIWCLFTAFGIPTGDCSR